MLDDTDIENIITPKGVCSVTTIIAICVTRPGRAPGVVGKVGGGIGGTRQAEGRVSGIRQGGVYSVLLGGGNAGTNGRLCFIITCTLLAGLVAC